MKLYFYKTYGPYIGCEETGVIEADDEQDANEGVYHIAQNNYESYLTDDDDLEVEPEYDYYIEEYDPQTHDHQLYPEDVEYAKEFLNKPHQA